MNDRVRKALIRVYNRTCQYCGLQFDECHLHIDHIDPVSRGGSDSVFNLTLACSTCNSRKGNLILAEPGRSLLLAIAKNRGERIIPFLNGDRANLSPFSYREETISLGEFHRDQAEEGYVKTRWSKLWLPYELTKATDGWD